MNNFLRGTRLHATFDATTSSNIELTFFTTKVDSIQAEPSGSVINIGAESYHVKESREALIKDITGYWD